MFRQAQDKLSVELEVDANGVVSLRVVNGPETWQKTFSAVRSLCAARVRLTIIDSAGERQAERRGHRADGAGGGRVCAVR